MNGAALRQLLSCVAVAICTAGALARAGVPAGDADRLCRGTPSVQGSLSLARVTRTSAADLYWDKGFRKYCPSADRSCVAGSIAHGEELLVSDRQAGYACVFHPDDVGGRGGWMRASDLQTAPLPVGTLSPALWVGEWGDAETNFSIEAAAGSFLSITGTLRGPAGQRGSFSGLARPSDGRVVVGRKEKLPYSCIVEMRLLGRYLVVNDNHACSGVRVSFSGVYVRRAAI